MQAAACGELAGMRAEWDQRDAVCVVMASGGYPGDYETGKVIEGIEAAESMDGVKVFHAGTARDAQGRWVTSGGRVLGVTALGEGVAQAASAAYTAAAMISWQGAHYRRDIAHRAVAHTAV